MHQLNRRSYLAGLLSAVATARVTGRGVFAASTGGPANACVTRAAERPLVGAIRWDAWYDPADGRVAQAVENALGPAEFHYRMPFFGRETGPDSVRINGHSQEIIDQEIGAAAGAGLDYWAYCLYDIDDPMSQPLQMHLASKRRSDIQFCAITSLSSAGTNPWKPHNTKYLINLMCEPDYVRVLDNRPIIYVMSKPEKVIQGFGQKNVIDWIQTIRTEVQRRGAANPYIVLTNEYDFKRHADGRPGRAQTLSVTLDLDAVSFYATTWGSHMKKEPYTTLASRVEDYWDLLASETGMPIIPNDDRMGSEPACSSATALGTPKPRQEPRTQILRPWRSRGHCAPLGKRYPVARNVQGEISSSNSAYLRLG